MPEQVRAIASAENHNNRLSGIIPIIAEMLSYDVKVKTAHLCHSDVEQIYKAKGEGDHFCGYRNIQMLLSGIKSQLGNRKGKQSYTIVELQDLIEEAWAMGINRNGFIETGGIKDTRKHIGTSEVSYAQPILSSHSRY